MKTLRVTNSLLGWVAMGLVPEIFRVVVASTVKS